MNELNLEKKSFGEKVGDFLGKPVVRARADVAIVARVLCRRSLSSAKNCADSAWARITASEWPTTSWTSRARFA